MKQNEIDFVAEKNGEKHYFQIALSINDKKTLQREFGNLKQIEDNFPKTVITMDKFSGNTHEGINILDLRTFLSQTD
jgi:predicted AAA+ superfamily ATPase